ncbi:hypothetical protein D9M71_840300 [compost metagenome]
MGGRLYIDQTAHQFLPGKGFACVLGSVACMDAACAATSEDAPSAEALWQSYSLPRDASTGRTLGRVEL